jgi:allantoinase
MVTRQPEKARAPQTAEWAIRGKCVITPQGAREAAVLVRGEKITAVVAPDQVPAGCPVEDVGDRVLLPGLVDAHVHINEPGRTEWEGFETATRAAAAGGITTLVDMPLNSSPVTTTADALVQKRAAAEGKLWVDCGFYGGVVPGNTDDIEPLIAAGVLGFKAFLCPSGIDEFPNATETDLRAALPKLATAGLPLLVHAELVSPPAPLTLPSPPAGGEGRVRGGVEARLAADPRSYAAYLASRPRQWEHAAIQLLINLCGEYRCPTHVVHLSSADALPLIREARAAGLPLTVETCPHYLALAAEEVPDGDPRFKCAPPIRERDNRERLWGGLRDGLIDTIGSDHSPAPPGLKHLATGNLQRAWGGIASLQLVLSVVWTAAQPRGATLVDLVDWMGRRPARLVGLGGRKGALAPGYDADLVVFDSLAEFAVAPGMLHHRHKLTPYEGRTLRGRVDMTFLRGRKVYDAGRFDGSPGGCMIRRPADPAGGT